MAEVPLSAGMRVRCVKNSGFNDGTLVLGKTYVVRESDPEWPDLVSIIGFDRDIRFRSMRFKPLVRIKAGRAALAQVQP